MKVHFALHTQSSVSFAAGCSASVQATVKVPVVQVVEANVGRTVFSGLVYYDKG